MRCGRVGGREELTKSRPMGSTSHSGEHHLGEVVKVEGDGDEDRHNAGWFQDDCDYVDRDDEDDYDDDDVDCFDSYVDAQGDSAGGLGE